MVAALRLSLQVDESASILAARMVAAHGLPVLPSGVLYLQGTTLSYLLAPFAWMGWSDPAHLVVLRLVCAVAGTVAVYTIARLTTLVTDSDGAGLLAALLLAVDPLSVQWSGHVRMYALLQALTIGLVWLAVRTIEHPTRWGWAGLVGFSWAAVFTHPAALLPVGLVLLTVAVRVLTGPGRRAAAGALGAGGLAPFVYLLLNHGTHLDDRTSVGAADIAFVGAQLLRPEGVFRPDLGRWATLIDNGPQGSWVPVLLALASGVLILRAGGGWIARRPSNHGGGVLLMLAVYWLSILVMTGTVGTFQPRYLVFVQPIGLALAIVTLAWSWRMCLGGGRGADLLRRVGAAPILIGSIALAALLLAGGEAGLRARFDDPVVDPDYLAAFAFVERHRQPGEPVIVSLPSLAAFGLSDTNDVMFLAGPQRSTRVARYTLGAPNGEPVDYWLGVPAITSTEALCRTLAAYPDAWLIVDEDRIWSDLAYRGSMTDVILGATYGIFRAPDGALVRRPAPSTSQTPNARYWCDGA